MTTAQSILIGLTGYIGLCHLLARTSATFYTTWRGRRRKIRDLPGRTVFVALFIPFALAWWTWPFVLITLVLVEVL